MADNTFIVQTPSEVVGYNDGNDKTIIQVQAPSTMSVKILGWGIFFDGISITNSPIQVMLYRQSSAGSMTSTTAIPLKGYVESINSLAGYNAVIEPSNVNLLDSVEVHPQAGFQVSYNEDERPIIPRSGYVGIVINADASVNVRAKIICEE